jgi:DNA-binding MarR family transcriptional regulator
MDPDVSRLREALRLLERMLGIIDDSARSCCGVSFAQCHHLVEIGRASTVSLNDLAALLDLDKSTVSRTVDQLVRQGLANRQPDPASRRNVRISLTPAGRDLFSGIEADMQDYYSRILENIPAAKHGPIIEGLQMLADAAAKVR